MTKSRKDSSGRGQQSLLEYLERAELLSRQSCSLSPGSLDIDLELKAAIAEDLRHATDEDGRELSRAEVAARITDLTGHEITPAILYNWTASSHPHTPPAKIMPAFCVATGGRRAMECIAGHAGLFVFMGEDALLADIKRLEETRKQVTGEIRKRQTLLKEIRSD